MRLRHRTMDLPLCQFEITREECKEVSERVQRYLFKDAQDLQM